MALAKKRGKREPLSKERIELAALDVVEREGVENFSIRKLAIDLGCEAMSVYHYFPSKAHLMDSMLDRALSSVPAPSPSLPWRERLRQSILDYRAMGHRYPRFFQFVARHRHNTPTGLRWIEDILKALRKSGFDDETTGRCFRAVGYYIVGGVLDETAGYAKGPSAVEPVPNDVIERDYPEVAAVNRYFKPDQHEATFNLGLDMLLDGMAKLRREAARSKRKPSPPVTKEPPVTPASPRATSSRSSSR